MNGRLLRHSARLGFGFGVLAGGLIVILMAVYWGDWNDPLAFLFIIWLPPAFLIGGLVYLVLFLVVGGVHIAAARHLQVGPLSYAIGGALLGCPVYFVWAVWIAGGPGAAWSMLGTALLIWGGPVLSALVGAAVGWRVRAALARPPWSREGQFPPDL